MVIIQALLILLLTGGLIWIVVPYAVRRRSEARLSKLCADQRAIVLSYDDGPAAEMTPRLLDLLAEHGVRASFYVLGRNIATAPDHMTRMIAEGHEIGSHTFDHSNAWKTMPHRAARDLAAGIAAVRRAGGEARLFRPPHGKVTLGTFADAWRRGLRLAWWTVDSLDSRGPQARSSGQAVIEAITERGGGVVLMHDWDRPAAADGSPSHAEHVLDLTRRIIVFASENDYAIKGLEDVYLEAERR